MKKQSDALISAKDFTKEDKKTAISTFSLCSDSVFYYNIVGAIAVFAVTISLIFIPINIAEAITANPFFLAALQIIPMYVIAFPLFYLKLRKLPVAKREKTRIGIIEFCALLLMCLAVMEIGSIISSTVSVKLSDTFSLSFPTKFVSSMLHSPYSAPTFLVAVIFGPIVEELMFRKVLIDRLSIYGDRLAVIVSAVLFGLFHGTLSQVFYATLVGIIFGHVYTKTRRAGYNILLHMLVNLSGTLPILVYYSTVENPLPESSLGMSDLISASELIQNIYIVKSILILLGSVLLITSVFKKSYRLSSKCDIEIPKTKLLRIVVFNRGTIVFAVFSAFIILYPYFAEYFGWVY